MNYKCVWLEETNYVQVYLRSYSRETRPNLCAGTRSYHQAMVPLAKLVKPAGFPLEILNEFPDPSQSRQPVPVLDGDTVRNVSWPEVCAVCNYRFNAGDEFQYFQRRIYLNTATSEKLLWEDAPIGAMRNAWLYPASWQGEDGRSIIVKMPGDREWAIDSQCSNCSKPGDTNHRCWVRHGAPPNLTVNKDCVGMKYSTCSAGAGSIALPNWHGFLTGGELREC